jgi:hypothetical protein
MILLESKGNIFIIIGCILMILAPIIAYKSYNMAHNTIRINLSILILILGFVIFMHGLAYKDNRNKLNSDEIKYTIFGSIGLYLTFSFFASSI